MADTLKKIYAGSILGGSSTTVATTDSTTRLVLKNISISAAKYAVKATVKTSGTAISYPINIDSRSVSVAEGSNVVDVSETLSVDVLSPAYYALDPMDQTGVSKLVDVTDINKTSNTRLLPFVSSNEDIWLFYWNGSSANNLWCRVYTSSGTLKKASFKVSTAASTGSYGDSYSVVETTNFVHIGFRDSNGYPYVVKISKSNYAATQIYTTTNSVSLIGPVKDSAGFIYFMADTAPYSIQCYFETDTGATFFLADALPKYPQSMGDGNVYITSYNASAVYHIYIANGKVTPTSYYRVTVSSNNNSLQYLPRVTYIRDTDSYLVDGYYNFSSACFAKTLTRQQILGLKYNTGIIYGTAVAGDVVTVADPTKYTQAMYPYVYNGDGYIVNGCDFVTTTSSVSYLATPSTETYYGLPVVIADGYIPNPSYTRYYPKIGTNEGYFIMTSGLTTENKVYKIPMQANVSLRMEGIEVSV